jgi:hypothetical protein
VKCKSEFKNDPSNRTLKCELGRGHKGWHENGTTMWTEQDLVIVPRRRPRYAEDAPPEPKREEKKRVTASNSGR